MNLRLTVDEVSKKYRNRKVVLVDDQDRELGIAPIIDAHRGNGLQHRAFSLQLFRVVAGKTELLLQQRSIGKPAFPYYWANTCCYNMAPGENYLPRAVSRVREEMGVEGLSEERLKDIYKFSYTAQDMEGWCENELDTVIVGEWGGSVHINSDEVIEYRWIGWEELLLDIENHPDSYSPWFKIIVSDPRFRVYFE